MVKINGFIIEELAITRDELYQAIPTGDIDAFALIIVIKEHIKQLDQIIDYYTKVSKDNKLDNTENYKKKYNQAINLLESASHQIICDCEGIYTENQIHYDKTKQTNHHEECMTQKFNKDLNNLTEGKATW